MINHLIAFTRIIWLILILLSKIITHKLPPCTCQDYGPSAETLPVPATSSGYGLGLLSFRPHSSLPEDTTWRPQRLLLLQRLISNRVNPFQSMDFSPMLEFVSTLIKFSVWYFLINLRGVESLSDYGFRFNYSEITTEIGSQVHSCLLQPLAQTLRGTGDFILFTKILSLQTIAITVLASLNFCFLLTTRNTDEVN